MKKLLAGALCLHLFYACSNQDQSPEPEGVHDAARTFLENVLDGKFDEARKLMVLDPENNSWLNDTERKYARMSSEDKRSYREAELTIYDTRKVNDSISVIIYSNSFTNRRDSVKVVRMDQRWLIDLKYTFPSADTTGHGQ
jgi:hypothetical protein